MNEFLTYKSLCDLSDISSMYSTGHELSIKIREIADRATTNHYKVAVIGEFKRGKSSLINALVGTELMPTDILPMTAVNTHLIYSDEQKIIIQYKDGTTKTSTLEQLINFATKYDKDKEEQAQLISRVEVHYPSVFCKNHIEIIDTPGLNDNEKMTETTLNVLGEIDAAIMVISARSPLSETEQNLILTLIKEQGIHHIVFVVTHIDTISDDPEDQDRLINFIKTRITTKLLDLAKDRFSDNDDLCQKAIGILEEPDIFGVSSLLAIQGFNYDDNKKIKLSRFTHLKHKLLAILTAAQNIDTKLNCIDFAKLVNENIDQWKEHDISKADELIEKMNTLSAESDKFLKSYANTLTKNFLLVDEYFSHFDIPVIRKTNRFDGIRNDIIKVHINEICKLTQETDTRHDLIDALSQANDLSLNLIREQRAKDEEVVVTKLKKITEKLIELLPALIESSENYKWSSQVNEWFVNNEFPAFEKIESINVPQDHKVEIIAYVKAAVDDSLDVYQKSIIDYVALWRVMLFTIFDECAKHVKETDTATIIKEATENKNKIIFHHNSNKNKITNILNTTTNSEE